MVGGNINIAVPLKTKILSDFIISLFLHNAEHARSYAYSIISIEPQAILLSQPIART